MRKRRSVLLALVWIALMLGAQGIAARAAWLGLGVFCIGLAVMFGHVRRVMREGAPDA